MKCCCILCISIKLVVLVGLLSLVMFYCVLIIVDEIVFDVIGREMLFVVGVINLGFDGF